MPALIASNRTRALAVLGAQPAFKEFVHVGRPNVGDREQFLRRVGEMLDRNWLTNNGPLVQEFESRVASYVGVKHCVAMYNATVALEIAIRASGLKGEVIVPSYTFIATAHALQWQEITPVFCDVDPETHNLDPNRVVELITPRTTGVIGVHVWGRPCPIAELTALCRKRDLTLMFDAAHAFGCSYQGEMIGRFGLCEVFSFHATKFLNTFEGGAVVTNDDLLARKLRLMKNFGFAGYDNVIYIGTNGKMTEVAAAMGLTNLDNIGHIIGINQHNHEAYSRHLTGLPGLRFVEYDPSERSNFQYVVVEIDESEFGISRDELVAVLHAENVLARKYFWPGCHRMEPYKSYFPHAKLLLPNTEKVAAKVIVLPTGSAVSPPDIGVICDIIRSAHEQHQQVREILKTGRFPLRLAVPT